MLTLQQCAERLAISYCTVRKHVITGNLPGSKVGGWRVEEAELEAFIARTKTGPREPIAPPSEVPPVAVRRFA